MGVMNKIKKEFICRLLFPVILLAIISFAGSTYAQQEYLVLESPQNGAADIEQPVILTFSYNHTNAFLYRVVVDNNVDFSSPEIDHKISSLNNTVEDTIFNLDKGIMYYWYASVLTIGGWRSAETWYFTTQNPTDISETDIQGIPRIYKLYQNHPNPFNPSTTIRFALPEKQHVNISIYNVFGRKVETIVSKKLNAGNWEVGWDGEKYPTGIYYYRIKAGEFIRSKKMVLIK